ncbi:hypothetical protein [Aerococcus sp. Group 1]|uniref:hypothetical protein n=1 Tax=Aerococcus urinae (strain CCUG 59500 / ACS-120-V-Col10a) TaxID=2976812 RepID=UPI000200F3A1|nr:hypothetical protein [Aerococcus sp. Group 1]AEA01266.1 hypothetical protein HMPREF9243_0482 [Aerococcus sp. Group 1]MCY3031235.1 hypothetical protein [Aerococcus sp. Group 1]MCY3054897.1 hypothetical protein [Aerococcus sp. Group 1]MCY3056627.1 hypothetical protein [Aerococcus sp. Group 1]
MTARKTLLYIAGHYPDLDKADLQLLLERGIEIVTQIFTPDRWESPYALSEDQWLLSFNHTASAFLAYRLLEQLLYPIQVNASLAYGSLDSQAGLVASPAYHYASQALLEAQSLGEGVLLYNANYLEDQLTNMLLLAWQEIIKGQSEIQRALRLSYELQFPLYTAYAMTSEWPFQEIEALEILKMPVYALEEKLQDYQTIDFQARKPLKIVDLHAKIQSDHFYVTGLYEKGYASAIAKMNQTSRQNVDYHLKSGRFAAERNYAAAIVLQLEREENALSV